MNGINHTSIEILEALNEWGEEARYCNECREFFVRGCEAHEGHTRYSYDDLRVALEEAYDCEISEIASALGLNCQNHAEILKAINNLKQRAA